MADPTPAQLDAQAIVRSYLDAYGLGALADWAWQQIVTGASPAQIEVTLPDQAAFKAAYPEYEALRKQGNPMSVAEIQSYRQTAKALAHQYGLTPGFMTNERISQLLIGGASPAELNARIQDASAAAYNIPPEARGRFLDYYGNHGDLTTYMLDPTIAEPLLHQQFVAAQVGAEAQRSSYGGIDRATAEALAARGIDAAGAAKGFGTLVHEQQLFNPLNAGETAITPEEQLAATFANDANAQERIRRRAMERVASFDTGGGFAQGKAGTEGLASAAT